MPTNNCDNCKHQVKVSSAGPGLCRYSCRRVYEWDSVTCLLWQPRDEDRAECPSCRWPTPYHDADRCEVEL